MKLVIVSDWEQCNAFIRVTPQAFRLELSPDELEVVNVNGRITVRLLTRTPTVIDQECVPPLPEGVLG